MEGAERGSELALVRSKRSERIDAHVQERCS
jgi:hypothetical protein